MILDFHFDIVCPYAYLASTRVEALAARTGATLRWKPVLLGGILRAVGAPDVPADTWAPAKVVLGEKDLARQAELRGVPLLRHPAHPQRSLQAMRLLCLADDPRRGPLAHALFEAYHVHGRDLTDRSVLAELAGRFGLDPAGLDDAAVKDALRARTAEAIDRGAFGVPSFWVQPPVGEGRLWFGTDRMHLVEASLLGVRRRDDAPPGLRVSGPLSQEPAVAALRAAPQGRSSLELFHDFSSPFSYLGFTQAARLAAEHDAPLVLRPMLLGALFRDIGTPMIPLQAMNAAKAAYQARDLADQARWWGVPFAFPSCFPVRTVTALRAAIAEPAITPHVYRALWAEGRDIGDDAVLTDVLLAAGFDGPALIERTRDPAIKQVLHRHTGEAVAMGACGAPTWRVTGTDRIGAPRPETVVWGQDRLDLVGALLDGWVPAAG